MSKRAKKGKSAPPAEPEAKPTSEVAEGEDTGQTIAPGPGMDAAPDVDIREAPISDHAMDFEATVNLTGDIFAIPGRDDLEATTQTGLPDAVEEGLPAATRKHLRGLLEALIFASDHPIKPNELAKTASAQAKEVKELLEELRSDYVGRGVQLEEIAGGWLFRTSPVYAPFVRDLTKQKPVKLTRAQIETLAILAYRQPITRPEIDEIRGVDSGPVLKLLLERDLVRILGKKDEPGRPLLYGTTNEFLEFFGLKSVKDLPTLREFTELSEDSRRVVEQELGETLESVQAAATLADERAEESPSSGMPRDTLPPQEPHEPHDADQAITAERDAHEHEPQEPEPQEPDPHEPDPHEP